MIKLLKAEIRFLKGFNDKELELFIIDFPDRKENTLEFKRRYKWSKGKW